MSDEDGDTSQENETKDIASKSSIIRARFVRIYQRFSSSRIPFLFIGVIVTLVIAKLLLVLSLQWIIFEDVLPNSWLYLDPYDANDIEGTPEIILALANRWDSQHFLELARNGYPAGSEIGLLYAFAPIYPWMVAVLNQLVGNLYISGVIVSNAFYFLSIFAFYAVARLYMDYEKSCLLSLVFGLFPTYLVYGTLAYSEAPYLFFSIASWYFFKKKWYLPCAIFMTLSILTRYISGLLVVIFGLIILSEFIDKFRQEHSLRKAFNFRVLWFLIPGICVTLVFLYFQTLTGRFFAAFEAHAWFGDNLATPYHQFRWFFDGYFVELNPSVDPFMLMLLRYMFTLPFFTLALLLFKDDVELGLYGVLFMWFTLSMEGISGIASPRIMLSAWVAFLALKNRVSKGILLVMAVMFFLIGIWVMYQFQLTFFA